MQPESEFNEFELGIELGELPTADLNHWFKSFLNLFWTGSS